jgi:Domain of unknown function (DUF4167)
MQNGRDTNMRKRANIDRQGHLLAAHSGGHRVRPGQSHGALTMLEETMRYLASAQAEVQAGDRVAAENYYQHAEHYFRSMSMD